MAPAREAVGFVQYPHTDLTLMQHAAKGPAAELFGGNEHDARVAKPDPVQGGRPLGQGQQAVDGHAGADAVRVEARHLVCHEGDQGRDHDGQGAGLVVAGQSRDLVAQRFAGAGGQDPQHVLSGQRCLDDGFLHRTAVGMRRLGTEGGEVEPAAEFFAGVVALAAPGAGGIGAGSIPQAADQPAGCRKLVADPRRHD